MKDMPPHAVEMVDRSGKGKVRSTVSSRINYLALVNLKPGPMQDLWVRQAISYAVSVDALLPRHIKGRAPKTSASLPPPTVASAPRSHGEQSVRQTPQS